MPRTLELTRPPARQADPEGYRDPGTGLAAVLAPLTGLVSGIGFAVLAGNAEFLLVSGVVAGSAIGGAFLHRRSTRRAELRRQGRARDVYLAYVVSLEQTSAAAAAKQRAMLEREHPAATALAAEPGCTARLWERRPEHDDYGVVRVGLGPVPSLLQLKLASPSGPFYEPDPRLLAAAGAAVDRSALLGAAPVLLPLREHASVAVVGPPSSIRSLARSWATQLAMLHSPADVAVAVWSDAAAADTWRWARGMPHAPQPTPTGSDKLALVLDQATARRPGTPTWTVLFVDDHRPGRPPADLPALARAISAPPGGPTTVVALCTRATHVPATVSARVDVADDGTCGLWQRGQPDGPARAGVLPDQLDQAAADRLARWLAPRRDASSRSGGPAGEPGPPPPHPVDHLLGAEQVRAAPALVVPIGTGAGGDPVLLDLRESADGGHGPHGVLVGATGSGKSELLRAIVTGLAARHSARGVGVLLVDFKGGAAFGPLDHLPHVAGLVTNLGADPSSLERVRHALEGELDRRQQILRDLGHDSLTTAAAADAHEPGRPFGSLVVVVDELSELIERHPALIDTFVRAGRLGRSLGVHLLLASQRLDMGRLRDLESHLRYRIALRTFSAADSVAVLGTAAAAQLAPVPGLGLFAVDGSVTGFRGAQVTAQDGATALIESLSRGDQPTATRVWLPPLPDRLTLRDLRTLVTGASDAPELAAWPVAVGLVDEPRQRRQSALTVDLVGGVGSVGIVGGPRSGRTTFLRTLVAAHVAGYDPDRFQVYALAGGADLRDLDSLPHVGAVAAPHDRDLVRRVLAELVAMTEERAVALDLAGAASLDDLGDDGHPLAGPVLPDPLRAHLLLAVDDVGRLRRQHPDVQDALAVLAAAGPRPGIHLAVTAGRWSELWPALLDCLDVRVELWLADPVESMCGRAAAERVPRVPGRGLTADGRLLQVALPGSREVATGTASHRAAPIRTLPRRLSEDAVATDPCSGKFLLGVTEQRLAPVCLDLLSPGSHLLVIGDRGSGRSTVLRRAVRHITDTARLPVEVHLVDPRGSLADVAGRPGTVLGCDADATTRLLADLSVSLRSRLPPHRNRRGTGAPPRPAGREAVLVVDDLDVLSEADLTALASLANPLIRAADVGLHVLLARSPSQRHRYDAFGSALETAAPVVLLLSGDRSHGPQVAGVLHSLQPPGRGTLVGPGPDVRVVQCCLPAGAG
jgi:DNA segregation ATPase FtsK/SpoIIIE, S-DNA-T family